VPAIVAIRALSFLIFRTYSGIIQHTSTEDAQKIFIAIASGSLLVELSNIISFQISDKYLIPHSVIIIDSFLSIFLMTGIRLIFKKLYFEIKKSNIEKIKILIYGAGESGVITKRTLERDVGTNYKVSAFIDDDPHLASKKIEGATIYHTMKLDKFLNENDIKLLIISVQNISVKTKQKIIDTCLKYKVKVLNVPPVSKWINGELSFRQIKAIKIEDLLEREPIELDKREIKQQIVGKRVLITGAAGSIGSEIVRQLIPFNPEKIFLLDQAETPLYELELELHQKYRLNNYEIVIGDVRNKKRMENVFRTFKPHYVYHAAAYKHVPLMEDNPTESILTNVQGTTVITDLAINYKVEKFVFISTDKAVNPTNIMGASKRIAEIYVQSLNQHIAKLGSFPTRFITTRFGNVLGSNGSVIPLFRKQIEAGGPITITDPNVNRYFMTIPEACQLVLEAGAMGKGGEIFIFDMGESVKIADLAKKMVKLSGLELGKDIQLIFTGLRPGEKLQEELLNNQENVVPTHHKKIMIAKVRAYEFDKIEKDIDELIKLFEKQDNLKIVSKMKEIVPEFISKNSVFEQLDLAPLERNA